MPRQAQAHFEAVTWRGLGWGSEMGDFQNMCIGGVISGVHVGRTRSRRSVAERLATLWIYLTRAWTIKPASAARVDPPIHHHFQANSLTYLLSATGRRSKHDIEVYIARAADCLWQAFRVLLCCYLMNEQAG